MRCADDCLTRLILMSHTIMRNFERPSRSVVMVDAGMLRVTPGRVLSAVDISNRWQCDGRRAIAAAPPNAWVEPGSNL